MNKTLVTLMTTLSLCLAACGGGGGEPEKARIQACHPDTWDCAAMYKSVYSHTWENQITGMQFYTDSTSVSEVSAFADPKGDKIVYLELVR
jgi:hypothetical protein